MIELDDIHKAFGPKKVLQGFTLRVADGSTTALVGFSGAGKSGMLKHIVGLIEPDKGSVRVDGQEVVGLARDDLYELRRRVGYVFQKPKMVFLLLGAWLQAVRSWHRSISKIIAIFPSVSFRLTPIFCCVCTA